MGRPRRLQGIETRETRSGARYRGTVCVHGRQERGPWTTDPDEAIAWRERMLQNVRAGTVARWRMTLDEAAAAFVEGIGDGSIVNRSGRPYKPSIIRDYRRDLRVLVKIVGPKKRLDDVRLPDCRKAMAGLRRAGTLSDSNVRNKMMAFRSMYVWALESGYATVNPCVGLRTPVTDAKKRERIASMGEVHLLMGAIERPEDRAAFALAWGAGLRAGELLALDWDHVDLDVRWLTVEREVDLSTGLIIDPLTGRDLKPKSKAGERGIPISDRLALHLEDYATGRKRSGLLFPASAGHGRRDPSVPTPMSYSGLVARLKARWKACGLAHLGLHEARHTFASEMIAAGIGPKAISQYMGHSSITITFDRYGHLFPGHEAEALRLLNTYHEGMA